MMMAMDQTQAAAEVRKSGSEGRSQSDVYSPSGVNSPELAMGKIYPLKSSDLGKAQSESEAETTNQAEFVASDVQNSNLNQKIAKERLLNTVKKAASRKAQLDSIDSKRGSKEEVSPPEEYSLQQKSVLITEEQNLVSLDSLANELELAEIRQDIISANQSNQGHAQQRFGKAASPMMKAPAPKKRNPEIQLAIATFKTELTRTKQAGSQVATSLAVAPPTKPNF